jgi:hypothetical protein
LLVQQKEALELGRSKDLWKRWTDTFERKGQLDDAIKELGRRLKRVSQHDSKFTNLIWRTRGTSFFLSHNRNTRHQQ